jgi:N-acetyl sugar amidotransferase
MSSNKATDLGLPNKVCFCKRCVISNQRPSSTVEFKSNSRSRKQTINFDAYGVCSACRYAEQKKIIKWDDREAQLLELCDRFRSKDGSYDVVVPGSGGKDSAYTSHILKYKYNMNPLTVTWAPHLYTEIGFKNFTNWIHVGGLDNILFTPNGILHRHLTRLAFLNLLHPFQPFIIGQRIIGPRIALKYSIPLVMYGENQAEYGNDINDNTSPTMDSSFFSTDDPSQIFLGGQSINSILNDTNFKIADFAPYIPPSPKEISSRKVEVHYLGYYHRWDPQECYYYAVENTGFTANPERNEGTYSKYASIDDKIDRFHYYTTYIKFGLGQASYDAAQEIRNDKITREEGVHLVNKYDSEFPLKYFKEFLDYIDLSEEQFHATCDSFRSEHLWAKKEGKWALKHRLS